MHTQIHTHWSFAWNFFLEIYDIFSKTDLSFHNYIYQPSSIWVNSSIDLGSGLTSSDPIGFPQHCLGLEKLQDIITAWMDQENKGPMTIRNSICGPPHSAHGIQWKWVGVNNFSLGKPLALSLSKLYDPQT